ncbi:uncharacterized protein BO80DRAFT_78898 [Aspergillus ibericus CBS 121593]|uniref:Uncharacterized protein n=1 Tax=Aspergillus ibericus CBS 121593 TaxID=1448316 RepID=A0A395HFE0_9EURO|nr:hypothetical protein BO80DRAFT_78898 [Aspergillus ibericus CBS 121593]RAL05708.1 hypothetical protein BO80DRAFT_78898 [Aspergillus ibericus CBS 121593]
MGFPSTPYRGFCLACASLHLHMCPHLIQEMTAHDSTVANSCNPISYGCAWLSCSLPQIGLVCRAGVLELGTSHHHWSRPLLVSICMSTTCLMVQDTCNRDWRRASSAAKSCQMLNRTFWYMSRSTTAWQTGQSEDICLLDRFNWPVSAALEILIILRNAVCPRACSSLGPLAPNPPFFGRRTSSCSGL